MNNDLHPSGLTLDQIAMLRQKANEAASAAHAPYSKFRVGAAILLDDGEIFTGCNVENASFGLTNCAERSAVFTAVSKLGGNIGIRAVAVANLNHAASAPCGACRQVLLEFCSPDTWVFFPGPNGDDAVRFAELLPLAFHLSHD
jgi:cytidine deaminase